MDQQFIDEIFNIISDNVFVRIGLVIIALYLVQIIIRLISGVIIHRVVYRNQSRTIAASKQREKTLKVVFKRTTATILWIAGVVLIMSQLNFNWAGLAAGAGVMGLVIGFGAQKVAGDFIAGFFILLENQFDIGDIVEINDKAYGTVERIDLRTTHVRNLDGGLHIIANGEIVNMANHSYGWATMVVWLWFKNGSNIDLIEKVMNQVGKDMSSDEIWSKELKGSVGFDRVEDFGADGIKIRALGDTTPGMQWAVAGEFRRRLLPELAKANIDVAYPHRIIDQKD